MKNNQVNGAEVGADDNEIAEDTGYKYKSVAILTSIFAGLFAIAFIIMLVLFFVRKTENTVEPITFVYDESGENWDMDEQIDIFYNGTWGDDVVMPYSSGSYAFVFTNDSDSTLQYSIDLSEVNDYDISMCYKLKRDGSYVVGSYARADDFWCNGLTIEAHSSQYFELEWYWDGDVNDYNDTLAGMNEAIYTLTIMIVSFVV